MGDTRWVEHPPPRYRRRDEEPEAEVPAKRASLRVVSGSGKGAPTKKGPGDGGTRRAPRPASREHPARRRRRQQSEALEELRKLAGRRAPRVIEDLERAAEAYAAGRERDAARILRPLRDAYPEAAGVRELLGLCQYRLGNFAAAIKELEVFVGLTGSVEQHPVLMDCYRAQKRYPMVDTLWGEVAAVSPAPDIVAEGRIVLAGALADRGRVPEAIAVLDRRAERPKRVRPHHLRVWYALADLEERAGNLPRARALFEQIRREDASFADVAERLIALR